MRETGRGPFDSAQTAVSLFIKSPCIDDLEKETDADDLEKDLANVSVDIEANDDDEYKQALIQFDHYEETDKELTYLPQSSEFEKEITIYGLESRTEDLNIQEELSQVLDEKSASSKEHVFIPERDFELVNDDRLKCIKRAQVAESTLSLEKPRTEELKEEVECKTKRVVKTEHELEAELLDKSLLIDSLQSRLHKANELHSCLEKVAFDAITEVNVLKADLELKEVKILEQEFYINRLETEAEGLKMKLSKANEELEETQKHITEDRNKENEVEIEIALLKSELHKGRSRLAAASASEERAKVEKSAINIALHHLATELLEAKTENNRLKESMKKTSEDSNVMISREEYEVLLIKNSELANHVQKMMDQENYKTESEKLKKELQTANAKITELRSRAEHAISRAEAAEKVKETLEERVKRWKEQRAAKKKATTLTLHVESMNFVEEDDSLRYKSAPKVHQPLGKILNMKF